MKHPTAQPAVRQAAKAIGSVLRDLEQKTGGEVTDISLEDMVDTDPGTGAPVLEKSVEIDMRERPRRRWAS